MFDIVAIAAVLITQFICWRNIFFSLLFSVWVHCNIIFVVQKTFFIQNECLIGALRPLAEKIYPKQALLPSKGIFNFNFLALVVSEIIGGPKFTLRALRPLDAPSGKILVFKASTLPNFYSHTHNQAINQSNKFFHLAYGSQIWKDLKHLSLKTRGFTPRCAFLGYRWWQIMFMGPNPPQKNHFWGPFNAKPIIERALRKSHVNGG